MNKGLNRLLWSEGSMGALKLSEKGFTTKVVCKKHKGLSDTEKMLNSMKRRKSNVCLGNS